jgi:hypothetical protein
MLLWRKLTILFMTAALIVTIASPAMAFNSSQHCPPSDKALSPEPCQFGQTEGAPTQSGGPAASHRQATRGNLETVKGSPSSLVTHCRGVNEEKGVHVDHFNENAPATTGGGNC